MCDFTDFVTFSNARNNTCLVTRCAIFPISSLLATLVTIPVLLNRLFGGAFIIFIKKVFLSRLFGGSIHYFSGKSLVKQKKSI